MGKREIIEVIADELDLSKVKAEAVFDAIADEIKDALSRGEPVILRRFGTFSVHAKAARSGRNPKTGDEAPIAARRVVRFKPGTGFRAAVNSATQEIRDHP